VEEKLLYLLFIYQHNIDSASSYKERWNWMISNLTKEELKTDILRNLENEGIDLLNSYAL